MKPLAPASSLLFPLPPTPRPLSSPHPNVFPVLLPFRSASPPPPHPALVPSHFPLICPSLLFTIVFTCAVSSSNCRRHKQKWYRKYCDYRCPVSFILSCILSLLSPPPPPPHLSPSLSAPMTQILNQQTTLDCVGAANSNIDISSWRLEKLEAVMSCTCAWQYYQ